MARTADEQPSTHRFTHQSVTISIGKFTPTPVAQNEGGSAFHDTIGIKAALTTDDAKTMLKAMGVHSTAFLSKLPEEITQIPLAGCHFKRHTLVFSVGGIKILNWDEVELYGFIYTRTGDDTGDLTFSAKGIPTEANHRIIEDLVLEAKAKKRHSLGILPPPDGELLMVEPDSGIEIEEEEDPEVAPGNSRASTDKSGMNHAGNPEPETNGNVVPLQ